MVVGGGENEFGVFFFTINFKSSRFKSLCLIAANAARYAMKGAVLVKEFYCCLSVAIRVYYCWWVAGEAIDRG